MKYAAIEAHHTHFPVALMCRVSGVGCGPRAGFYAAQKRSASARARRDEELRRQIRTLHQPQSLHLWQPARSTPPLPAQGERCGRKRVARLMRALGLGVKVRRRSPAAND